MNYKLNEPWVYSLITWGMLRLARVKPAIKSLLNWWRPYFNPQRRTGNNPCKNMKALLVGGWFFNSLYFLPLGITASLIQQAISSHHLGGFSDFKTIPAVLACGRLQLSMSSSSMGISWVGRRLILLSWFEVFGRTRKSFNSKCLGEPRKG